MNNNECNKLRLQREREKLNRLVDKALENGTPIAQAYGIVEQSKKVQQLLLELDEKDGDSD